MRGGQAERDPKAERVRAVQDSAHSTVQGDPHCCAWDATKAQSEGELQGFPWPGAGSGLAAHTGWENSFPGLGGGGRLWGTLPWGDPQFAAVRRGTTRLTHTARRETEAQPNVPKPAPSPSHAQPPVLHHSPPSPPAQQAPPCTRQLLGHGTSVSTWPTFSRASASHHPPGWGQGRDTEKESISELSRAGAPRPHSVPDPHVGAQSPRASPPRCGGEKCEHVCVGPA